MKKKFVVNLLLLLTLNLLIKPFWILGIDRAVQNAVGAFDYGFYFTIFNFSFLFNVLLDCGITNYNMRNIAQHNQLLNKHFSRIVGLKLLLGLFFAVAALTVGVIIGYDAKQIKLLVWMVFNQFLISFVLYLRSNVSGLLLFRTDSLLSVLDRFLMIIFCAVLLWGNIFEGPFRIEWFVYAQTLAYGLTAVTALLVVINKSKFQRITWDFTFFRMVIKQSFPFALLALLMTFYNRIDSVLIERILPGNQGDYYSGIYASAYRLLDASNMIAYLFSILLLPLFSHLIKQKENVENLARTAFTLLFFASITVALCSFFFSSEIMGLMYKDHIEESAAVFKLLMLCFIPIATTYIFGTLLTANGSMKALNIVAGSGMIVNILLNFILIPRFYAVGSCYASITAQFLTSGIQVLLAVRIFKFKTNYNYLFKLLLFVIIVVVTGIFVKMVFSKWMYNLILMGVVCVVAVFALRLMTIKSLLSLVKKEAVTVEEEELPQVE